MFLASELSDSVIENLFCLFNSRQGTVPGLKDYGLPDLTSFYQGLPRSADQIISTVSDAIEKYEPRLKNVSVKLEDCFEPSNVVVRLEISGDLIGLRKSDLQGRFLACSDFLGNGKNYTRKQYNG